MSGGDVGFYRDYWAQRDHVRKAPDIAFYQELHDGVHQPVVNVPLVPSNSLQAAATAVTPTSGDVALTHSWK
jgi:hypothetical protein